MCEFEKFCVIGGGAPCEQGFCDEKERLNKLKAEKCPIMVSQGRDDRICDCDIPFWLRAFVPHSIPCARGNKCILKIYFPKIISQAIAGKLDPDRAGINHFASKIKFTIRVSEQQGRVNSPAPQSQAHTTA